MGKVDSLHGDSPMVLTDTYIYFNGKITDSHLFFMG